MDDTTRTILVVVGIILFSLIWIWRCHGSLFCRPTPQTTTTIAFSVPPASVPGDSYKTGSTLSDKVSQIAVQLGVDDSLPLNQKVAACNTALDIQATGSMVQQVDKLMTQIGL